VLPADSRPDRDGSAMDLRAWLGAGGILTVSSMLVGLLLVATLLIVRVTHHEQQVNETSVRYASAVAAAALDAKGAANDERGFLISADPKFAKEADRRVAAARTWLHAADRAARGAEQRRAVADARSGFERWTTAIASEFAGFRASDRASTVATSLGTTRALRKHYEADLARAQRVAADAIRSTDASVSATSSRTIAVLLACIVLAAIAGTACLVIFSRAVGIAGMARI
jgi:methyl-accepting chemotaxis protein